MEAISIDAECNYLSKEDNEWSIVTLKNPISST